MAELLEVILEKTKHLGRKALIAGLLLPIFYIGCEKDEEPKKEVYNRPKSEQTYEKTFVMQNDLLNKITVLGDDAISFSEPMSDNYGLKKGDIIIGGISSKTPNGVLKEIVSISQDQKNIVIKDASLEDAIKSGEINFDQSLNFVNLQEYSSIKGSDLSKGKGNYDFNLNFKDVLLYDEDGNSSTTLDRVVMNGGISFSIHPKMKFNFNEGFVSAYFATELPGEFYLNVQSQVGEAMLEAEKKIFSAKLNPIVIPATPVPIVICPKIELYLGMEGGTESNFKLGIKDEFLASNSLSYDNVSKWKWNQNFSNSFEFVTPELGSDMSTRFYVAPRLTFMVNGILGPYVKTEGYFRGEVDLLGNPWWKIYGGLEAKLGLDMNILSKYIPDFEKTFYALEKKISDAGGPLITINTRPTAILNATPSSGDTSTEFTFSGASSIDKEDTQSKLMARWDFETNGVWDSEYNTNKIVTHKFSNPGLYQVTLEIKDTQGAIDSRYTFIDVKSFQNLQEIIIQPGSTDGKDAGVALDTYCNIPPYSRGSGNDSIMEIIKYQSGCVGTYENALLSFPLDKIPKNSKVSSAQLYIYGYANINYVNDIPTFSLYKLKGSWEESNVKWDTKPASDKITSIDIINGGSNSWYSFNVTSTVQKWVDGESNFGFEVSSPKEGVFGKISSSDNPNISRRPKLIIKYSK